MMKKKSLLLEWLLNEENSELLLGDDSDEFANEIPGPNYTGDAISTDEFILGDIEAQQKTDPSGFDIDVPEPNYQGEPISIDDVPEDENHMEQIPQNISASTPIFTGTGPEAEPPKTAPGPDFSNLGGAGEQPDDITGGQPPENLQGIGTEDPGATGGIPPGMPGEIPPDQMGIPGIPEPLDPVDIGKVFILKKIYSRLIATGNNLEHLSGEKYEELKKISDEAIEHFQSVIKNFDQFKDKLDEVITLFQNFLVSLTKRIEDGIRNNSKSSQE